MPYYHLVPKNAFVENRIGWIHVKNNKTLKEDFKGKNILSKKMTLKEKISLSTF